MSARDKRDRVPRAQPDDGLDDPAPHGVADRLRPTRRGQSVRKSLERRDQRRQVCIGGDVIVLDVRDDGNLRLDGSRRCACDAVNRGCHSGSESSSASQLA